MNFSVYFVWTMDVLNRSFCFFFFFFPPFSSERKHNKTELQSRRRYQFVFLRGTLISHMSDLDQQQVVEDQPLRYPAAAVPSLWPGWRSSGSWGRGPGPSRRSPRRCLLLEERAAYLLERNTTSDFRKPPGSSTGTQNNRKQVLQETRSSCYFTRMKRQQQHVQKNSSLTDRLTSRMLFLLVFVYCCRVSFLIHQKRFYLMWELTGKHWFTSLVTLLSADIHLMRRHSQMNLWHLCNTYESSLKVSCSSL